MNNVISELPQFPCDATCLAMCRIKSNNMSATWTEKTQ